MGQLILKILSHQHNLPSFTCHTLLAIRLFIYFSHTSLIFILTKAEGPCAILQCYTILQVCQSPLFAQLAHFSTESPLAPPVGPPPAHPYPPPWLSQAFKCLEYRTFAAPAYDRLAQGCLLESTTRLVTLSTLACHGTQLVCPA